MMDLECPVTLEAYQATPEFQPRILPCGHTVSQAALRMLLEQPKVRQVCPTDRRPLMHASLEAFPVNYSILNLVESADKDLPTGVTAACRERKDPNNAPNGTQAPGKSSLRKVSAAGSDTGRHHPHSNSAASPPVGVSFPIKAEAAPGVKHPPSEPIPSNCLPNDHVSHYDRRMHRLRLVDELYPRLLCVLSACYSDQDAEALVSRSIDVLLDLSADELLQLLNVPSQLYRRLGVTMKVLRARQQIFQTALQADKASPLNRSRISAMAGPMQQQQLGHLLCAQVNGALQTVYDFQDAQHLAEKVTGMLLRAYNIYELLNMLQFPEELFETLADALQELQRHFCESPTTPSHRESREDTAVRNLFRRADAESRDVWRDRRLLGEWLFPKIVSIVAANFALQGGDSRDARCEVLAQKLTGMLLQVDAESVLRSLYDDSVLQRNVAQALTMLDDIPSPGAAGNSSGTRTRARHSDGNTNSTLPAKPENSDTNWHNASGSSDSVNMDGITRQMQDQLQVHSQSQSQPYQHPQRSSPTPKQQGSGSSQNASPYDSQHSWSASPDDLQLGNHDSQLSEQRALGRQGAYPTLNTSLSHSGSMSGDDWSTVQPKSRKPSASGGVITSKPKTTAAPPAGIQPRLEVDTRPVSGTNSFGSQFRVLPDDWADAVPQNPSMPVCEDWMEAGSCSAAPNCCKHHPIAPGSKLNNFGLPMRIGAAPCQYFCRTGACKYGKACKYHHPDLDPGPFQMRQNSGIPPATLNLSRPAMPQQLSAPHTAAFDYPPCKYEVANHTQGYYREYNRKPGAPVCSHYKRTGFCKYDDQCYFDHPEEFAVKLNLDGYPLRPDSLPCRHWMARKVCRFAADCVHHHPNLIAKA